MIIITQDENSITIEGHANYAEHGKDIVCAAVSVLSQTLIQSVLQMTDEKIKYVIQSGYIEIECERKLKETSLLFDAFFIGCQMLAANYPENVQLKRLAKH